jgi:hypothetical protein
MGGRWHQTSRRHTFSYGKGNENQESGTDIFVQRGIISAVKGVELVNDRISYIIL